MDDRIQIRFHIRPEQADKLEELMAKEGAERRGSFLRNRFDEWLTQQINLSSVGDLVKKSESRIEIMLANVERQLEQTRKDQQAIIEVFKKLSTGLAAQNAEFKSSLENVMNALANLNATNVLISDSDLQSIGARYQQGQLSEKENVDSFEDIKREDLY